jgi:hypothetical protein
VSSQLGVNETLALLNRLKCAASDFAAREQKLNQDLRIKATAQLNKHEKAVEEEAARLAAEIGQAEAVFHNRRATLDARYEGRKARIVQAHRASKKQVLERIELEEGGQKYAVQKGLLDTDRNRKAELAANDARYEEFKLRLAENSQAFGALEQDARKAFRGYRSYRRLLSQPAVEAESGLSQDELQLLAGLNDLHAKTGDELARFQKLRTPRIFKHISAWLLTLLLVLGHGALALALRYSEVDTVSYGHVAMSLLVLLAVLWSVYHSGKRKARPFAAAIASALKQALQWHNACLEKSATRRQREIERIEDEARSRVQTLNQRWDQALEKAAARRGSWPPMIEEKAARVAENNEQLYRQKLARLERDYADAVKRLKQESETRKRPLAEAHEKKMAQLDADGLARWQALETEWRSLMHPIFETIQAANVAAARVFPEWRSELWENWAAPAKMANVVKFAHLEVEVEKLCEGLPPDTRLALPGPSRFMLPLLLTYPRQGSILFETTRSGSEVVAETLNNIILRLFSQSPPRRLSFTIIDPVKLGQNFAGVMHLADYEENLINSRIRTQTSEIEQRLADLNEHMEKVIQMYLRNEYATIADYNEQAGSIAEKYHFLVIADFPVNFSETAIRRLVNIAASGARCGVYSLIHWDRRQALPPDFVLDELRRTSVCIACPDNIFVLAGQFLNGTRLVLDSPPAPDLTTNFLRKVGLSTKQADHVKVPFAQVAPSELEVWTNDTTEELRIPIGRTGATKLQCLAIGKGTRQHVLIAGKTGSGKSTLFHVIITNLALWCSPEQVEFYLVDFKKGVEFKCYAARRLPHARVVAIESDREFGFSVLQRVDGELRRRGDLFRQLGVQDLAGYKQAGGAEPMPRSLLLIDEFQEFFVEDDRISQGAAVLLDRIVRQGRAFGIHAILGSQTLGGAYTLARTTIGQMVIRIALQCNEADACLIMDDNNPAPRLLSRPGEGIYNDLAGAIEGNSPFQTVWLPEEERQSCLDRLRTLADRCPKVYPAPMVFEGNAPADLRENTALQMLLEAEPAEPPTAARIWLGAPNSIKGPTEAVFTRQSGNHLLLVGQREESILAIFSIALVSLAAQYPRQGARFFFLDSTAPGSAQRQFLQQTAQAIPQEMVLARSGDLAEIFSALANEMKRRAEDEREMEVQAIFLFILGLQNFKKLRLEEDFGFSVGEAEAAASPAALLNDLICEGAALGIHVIATCDTYNNLNRFLGRKALGEFAMRVLFQMSANDSASLIDNPKASALGLHRALFYNEHEGYLETFRPYAPPDSQWLDQAARNLTRR